MNKHESVALDWAEQTEKDPDAGMDVQAAARRFLRDLDCGRWDWKPEISIHAPREGSDQVRR